MTQYTVSIKDESKTNLVLSLLKDLNYVDVSKYEAQAPTKKRKPSEIITPIITDTFRHYSREELNER